jgi:hypothetical protein
MCAHYNLMQCYMHMPTVLQPSWGHYCGKFHPVKSSEPCRKQRNCHMLHYTAIYNAYYIRVESSGLRHKFIVELGRVLGADYGLSVPNNRDSTPESGKKLFSHHRFETGSTAHSSSYLMATWCSFHRSKAAGT